MSYAQIQRIQGTSWDRLRESLLSIKDINAFPALSVAVDSLLSCLGVIEVAMQNRQDYGDLASELATLLQSLKPHVSGWCSKQMPSSIARIIMTIEQQIRKIEEMLGRTPSEASTEAEDVVRHYRKIQSHFRQLEANANMCTQSIANEGSTNARLESLNFTWQAAYDSSLSVEINRRICTEGTRTEILDGLGKWLEDSESSPIYWINGMAGTGKTTIASTFCERAERCKLLAASFFCTRTSAGCRDTTQIVPTIANQLSRYSIPFRFALCQALNQNSDVGSKTILKQFEKLLKEPLQQVKDALPENMVVVIDALDECDDRNEMELVLDTLFRHATDVPLKFLLTSRPEPEIYSKMVAHIDSRHVIHLHDIENSLVQADIELYLKEGLEFISPSQFQIEELARRSGMLFIYAATLVKYISGKRSTDPRKRVRAVLDTTSESTKKYTQIDALYKIVLKSALGEYDMDADQVKATQTVLWVVLLAQEPISIGTIARLAGIGDPQFVVRSLEPLRSVLHQSETGLVSAFHASFPDFLFNKERSGPYFCDVRQHSQPLAQRCFSIMKQGLRFNICNLVSSFESDEKVGDLQERIEENIPSLLAYACRYWASHLERACTSIELLTALEEFLMHQFLFWMEVLSLRQELPVGLDGLLKAQQWLVHGGSSSTELMLFVGDARNFMSGFAVNSVSRSTPHIYLSALAFCPRSNTIYKHYYNRTKGLLELKGSLMERREAAPLATWTSMSGIQCLALSPDGTRIAIGCLDKNISILSAYDGTIYVGPLEGHTSSVVSVAFSPNGGRIVSASLGGIRVWNAYNGSLISGPFKGHMRLINSVSFSPDGTRVVSCGHDCTIRIWNAYDGTPLLGPLTDHADLVQRVSFSPDGALIASASSDRTVRLWNSDDGTPATSPLTGHTGRVDSLVFTPDGTQLISGSGDSIRVWKMPEGSFITSSFEGYLGGVNALAISRDSTRVAAGCDDRCVRVWRISDGKLLAGPFFHHKEPIKSVAYSPDGTRVISGSTDRTINVWNIRDGMLLPPPLPPQKAVLAIKSVTFCPDSIHFLSSDGFGVVRIWDTSDASFITVPDKGVFFPTPRSMLSLDGSFIASTSPTGELQIVSSTNGSRVAGPFGIERDALSTFEFSHNNKAILMGCHDGTIKVCDLQCGNAAVGSFTAHHKGVRSLTESPDCSLLVSYSDYDNAIRVWNIVSPALNLKLFSNSASDGNLQHVYPAVYDGWNIMEDGWVVNNSQHLLFWLPPDIALAWCSPYASLVVTDSGTLQVLKQEPFVGYQWIKCYTPE